MLKLQEKYISFKIKRASKKNRYRRQTVNYDEAHEIGILFTIEDEFKHEEIKKFIKKLDFDGKKVQVLAFLGKDKENFEFRYDFFTKSDISFWGKINSDNIHKFINKDFDYLFNLDFEPNIYVRNILARSKAKCRVGNFYEEENPMLDMMVRVPDEENNLSEFYQQIYYYTTCLLDHK